MGEITNRKLAREEILENGMKRIKDVFRGFYGYLVLHCLVNIGFSTDVLITADVSGQYSPFCSGVLG
jgi:hypothetical protein